MDFIFDLLPALFIFWFVTRAIRGSNRRRARQRPAPQPGGTVGGRPASSYSGFEELVRRLEEAAAEAQRKQGAVAPPPPVLPTRASVRPPPPIEEDEFAFHSSESMGKDFGFAAETTAKEFRYVGGIGEGVQATEFHETHPLEVSRTVAASQPMKQSVHPLVERLRTPASAREALLLRDILSPPRSRTGGRA